MFVPLGVHLGSTLECTDVVTLTSGAYAEHGLVPLVGTSFKGDTNLLFRNGTLGGKKQDIFVPFTVSELYWPLNIVNLCLILKS